MRSSRESALRVLVIGVGLDAGLGSERDPDVEWKITGFGAITASVAAQSPAQPDVAVLMSTSIPRARRIAEVQRATRELHAVAPDLRIIAVVGENDARTAAAALDAGAWDVARENQAGHLRDRLRAITATRRLESGEAGERAGVHASWHEMIGTSQAMLGVFALIRRVAASDVPVLLTGESGTGKELVALAIHERSQRARGPFVPINCAAIPDGLLESELFGHERGAFTGAIRSTQGRVEAAHGGTLFLDEVGETSPGLQVKLLRFLEDHVVDKVGNPRGRTVNVRVIAATNRDPAELLQCKLFRDDLYYRLAVMRIHLPPLRDRLEDVLLMARIFLLRYAQLAGRELRGLAPDAIEALWNWRWPGNVRELINRIRRAVVVSDGPLVSAADLDLDGPQPEARIPTLREAVWMSQHRSLQGALQRAGGSRSEAARILGVSRSTLYELLRRHRLSESAQR
jgi:two-component system NtrC family response regulator